MSVARFIHSPKTRQRLFSGPLDTHIDDFAEQLFCNGYNHEMGRRKVWVVAHFNHWISDKGIDLHDIDGQTISSFIRIFRARTTTSL